MDEERSDVLLLTSPRPPWLSPKAFLVSENSCPPLGLLYLAAALEAQHVTVQIEDLYFSGLRPRDVGNLVVQHRPRMLGISVRTSGVDLAIAAFRHAKTADPRLFTVVGGPHATAVPAELLQCADIDVVVRGEGEATLAELASVVLDEGGTPNSLRSIRGIAFRSNGTTVFTEDRALLDIDSIPEPARHLICVQDYLQPGAVLASRGCPYRCFFCSSVAFSSHQYRARDPRAVVREMDCLNRSCGLLEFEFVDDVLTANRQMVTALCGLLTAREYRWGCQGTIKDVRADPKLLGRMARAGCRGVFFGVEAGNNDVLQRVKGISVSDVIHAVDEAAGLGMRVITSFMIGHPWDTRSTVADTLALMTELGARGCHTPVSILVPFPGSQLARFPARFGVQVDSHDYSAYYHSRSLVTTRSLGREELEEIYFDMLCELTESPRGQCTHSNGEENP